MKTTTAVIIVLIVAVAGIAAWKLGAFGTSSNDAGQTDNNTPPIAQIGEHCGGNIANAAVCVQGSHCAPTPGSSLPFGDVGGTCIADAVSTSSTQVPQTITITYTSAGFSPQTVTIHKGDTVKWVNNTSGQMWIASAVHPSHKVYSGTELSAHCPDTANASFDQCAGSAPGTTWSFTFDKVGAWGYHDHLHSSKGGKVTVQ